MRVLICGSRDWTAKAPIEHVLDGIVAAYGGCTVISGMARGADMIAADWARRAERDMGVTLDEYPADWEGDGRAAGPIRNKRMLDEGKPSVVFAFKDNFDWTLKGGGTEHMVKIAKAAGVPTFVMSRA